MDGTVWSVRSLPRDEKILLALFLLTLPLLNPTLRGDGLGYYAHAASILFDGDFNYTDEYAHIDASHRHLYFDEEGRVLPGTLTAAGVPVDKYPVGPSILWAPFLSLAHAGVSLHNLAASEPVATDGFSAPYLWAAALGSACAGFLGLFLTHRLVKRLFDPSPALGGTIGVWFAAACPVYFLLLPFYAHAASVLVCALLLWTWWRTYPERTAKGWFLMGLLCGVAFTTYYINVVLWIFPLADLVEGLTSRTKRSMIRPLSMLCAVAGIGIGLLPHGIVKWGIYGDPFALGYTESWFFTSPRLWAVLFSTEHGLWSWTPILLLSCVGLGLLVRRSAPLGWRCLLCFAALWYLIASYENWHGQSSFSNRFFVTVMPIFVLGLASVWDGWVKSSGRNRIAWALTVVLCLWNFGFIFQWAVNLVPNRGSVDFGVVARNQVTAVPRKALGTAARFFTDRGALLEEVEDEDRREGKNYRPTR